MVKIYGMSGSLCRQAQNTVNRALRAVVGHKRRDTAQSCAAVWRESEVPPVCAVGAQEGRELPVSFLV